MDELEVETSYEEGFAVGAVRARRYGRAGDDDAVVVFGRPPLFDGAGLLLFAFEGKELKRDAEMPGMHAFAVEGGGGTELIELSGGQRGLGHRAQTG